MKNKLRQWKQLNEAMAHRSTIVINWKEWIAIGIMLFVLTGYLLHSKETFVQRLLPGLTFQQTHTMQAQEIAKDVMRSVFPGLLYAGETGQVLEEQSIESEIPDYFYQDETTDAVAEQGPGNANAAENVDINGTIPVSGATQITGIQYTREQLTDFQFMLDHCYVVDSTTYVNREEMNADALLSMDMTMQQDASDYQILIYHTHSSTEEFADSRPGVLEDTPIGLGDTLTKLLEAYGYRVYHDRTVYDQIDGKTDRNYAYTASGEAIDKILAEHPSIEVVIDLHRDGVNENTHLVTEINGKPTAKIMFFNGVSRTTSNGELEYLANPNRQANLAFSLQMYLKGSAEYPDFLRRIYIKGYQYNLDRRPKATLIEVGGQTNTVEEANNAMEPLADILHQVLSGE